MRLSTFLTGNSLKLFFLKKEYMLADWSIESFLFSGCFIRLSEGEEIPGKVRKARG